MASIHLGALVPQPWTILLAYAPTTAAACSFFWTRLLDSSSSSSGPFLFCLSPSLCTFAILLSSFFTWCVASRVLRWQAGMAGRVPDPGGAVGRAGDEAGDVRAEDALQQVARVLCVEYATWGVVFARPRAPAEDATAVARSHHKGSVARHRDRLDGRLRRRPTFAGGNEEAWQDTFDMERQEKARTKPTLVGGCATAPHGRFLGRSLAGRRWPADPRHARFQPGPLTKARVETERGEAEEDVKRVRVHGLRVAGLRPSDPSSPRTHRPRHSARRSRPRCDLR